MEGAFNLDTFLEEGRYYGHLYPSNVEGLPLSLKIAIDENVELIVKHIFGDVYVQIWTQIGTNNISIIRYKGVLGWASWQKFISFSEDNIVS